MVIRSLRRTLQNLWPPSPTPTSMTWLDTWVAANHFWPSIIYRSAGASVRDRIVAAIDSGRANVDHALSALAWIGDGDVVKLFQIWEAEPPSWRSSLFIGPSRYAHLAGWEPSAFGRRNLYFEQCLAIMPAGSGGESVRSIEVFRRSEERCRWCAGPMAHLIDLDIRDSLFGFFGLRGPRLPVLTCERCTCFGDHHFARFTEDGAAHWFEGNARPNWLPENISTWPPGPWTEIPVRLSPRRPMEAADWCMEIPASQIGGLPCWVQDAAYPQCPSCKQTMKFIAQLDNAQFPSHEGIYYAFLCESCRITATAYQQT